MALLWTSNEDNILTDMVLSDKTVNEIAASLNRARDSVAGRIRRLRAVGKLPTPEKPIKLESTSRNESKRKRKTIKSESTSGPETKANCGESTSSKEPKPKKAKPPKEPPYVPEPRPLHPLEKLGQRDCRWPMGDPRDRVSFQFCGKPIEPGFPYCHDHTLKAFSSGISRVREMENAD